MNEPFLTYLRQVGGEQCWLPTTHEETCIQMIHLAWFFAHTPSHQWWLSQRTELLQHLFPSLCYPPPAEEIKSIIDYLRLVWSITKTRVIMEMDYPPCLILSAYMLCYGSQPYNNAGELVERILTFEEQHVPVWDITPVLQLLSGTDIPSIQLREEHPSRQDRVSPKNEKPADIREQLINDIVKMRTHWRCKVCLQQEASYVIIDCEHLAFCEACLDHQTQCPLCGLTFQQTMRIYLC